MNRTLFRPLAAAALLGIAGPALAQGQTPAPAAPKSGIRAELLANLEDVQKKITSLAEAMPADKYGWRPGPEVRSVAEVFMHLGTANYTIPKFIAVTPPEGTGFEMEKQVTEKAKVVEFAKGSLEHLRQAIIKTPDQDLDTKVKLFGQEMTKRGVLLLLVTHNHEHLGQAIAYARANGVVPPWSEKAPAPPKPAAAK